MLTIYNIRHPRRFKEALRTAHGTVSLVLSDGTLLRLNGNPAAMEIAQGMSCGATGVKIHAKNAEDMQALLYSIM